MGSQYPRNYRTDEQLQVILFETATWTVNGMNGQVSCAAPSLRRALDRAAGFAASGAIVAARCRLPCDNIIIFEAQAERLRRHCAEREAFPVQKVEYWGIADSAN